MLFVVLLAVVPAWAAMPDFTQAIRYTAPTNFYGGVAGGMRTDPGDNPFSLEGPDVLSYKDRGDWNCGASCSDLVWSAPMWGRER